MGQIKGLLIPCFMRLKRHFQPEIRVNSGFRVCSVSTGGIFDDEKARNHRR